jgi:AraC family transcriptional regulator, regulatory protein of adaptative response / DNA-3-methyladenine glycosylase II
MTDYSHTLSDADKAAYRRARLARDDRFDGVFYLAVKSTGIYCRPICPARQAGEQNVEYYRHAAEAAALGYRPCLRCRPESAPGSPAWEGSSTTVKRALQLIDEGALNQGTMEQLAARLGVGERYLRKLFTREVGASPLAVANNRRLLFARKLITETGLPLTELAYAAGFGSIRRFNSALKEAYGSSPGALRRHRIPLAAAGISLQLSYRPPYDWDGVLGFYRRHAIEGLEQVSEQRYHRHALIAGQPVQFTVSQAERGHALQLQCEISDQRQLMPLVARVRRMFDLDANPEAIFTSLSSDARLATLAQRYPGIRAPLHFSPWESAVRAIVGQQVSVPAARTVLGRLTLAACGNSPTDFPDPAALAALDDSHFAMPQRRRQTLRTLCHTFAAKPDAINLEELAGLPGIGPWTVALVAMRGMGDPDVFPATDLGIVNAWSALGEASIKPPHENWRPWRSYATNLLWRSL